MKFAVVVQARTSSARLPGKVLMPLAGEPALLRMMERVERVHADVHVVATSDDPSDDPIALLCEANGLRCYRGPLNDVLSRVALAAPADHHVVRLTGDCPLIDPDLVADHIERFENEFPAVEYVSNAVERTFPDGLDVEVISRTCLDEAVAKATHLYDREHVTPWIQRAAKSAAITQEIDLSALRITLDDAEDYAVIAAIYEALHPIDDCFDTSDIYRLLLSRPELIRLAQGDRDDYVRRIEAHLTKDGP